MATPTPDSCHGHRCGDDQVEQHQRPIPKPRKSLANKSLARINKDEPTQMTGRIYEFRISILVFIYPSQFYFPFGFLVFSFIYLRATERVHHYHTQQTTRDALRASLLPVS
jgi:hypothetical protein